MSERSSPPVRARYFLSAALISLSLTNAFAQQPADPLQLPPGARPGNSAQSPVLRSPAFLLAQVADESLEIPPVIERPLGMEEGPRVRVSRFELSGAVDRATSDISVAALNGILTAHVRSQPPDGYTISQLQAVADQITRYYRERGLILAQAIIPAQDVRGGVVAVRVLEGRLGEVMVEGNGIYSAGTVGGPFRHLRGRPVTQSSVERALLDVQNFPGLTVFGTFTQGEDLGNTDLIIRVREEERFEFTTSVDNNGSEFTGELRGLLDFRVNNLFGVADQVNGYVLQTYEPSNGTYGGLDFRFPFGRNAIGFGASTNQFEVGGLAVLGDLGIEGTAEQADLSLSRSFANGRFFSANGRLALVVKRAETEFAGTTLNEDRLAVARGVFEFFKAGQGSRAFNVGSLTVDVGIADFLGSMDGSGRLDGSTLGTSSRTGGDGEQAGGSFEKFGFQFQHLRRLTENTSVLLRLDGQWSDDLLVALEQYAIGGPQNVRAYPVAEALVDTGGSASLEWLLNAPGFADARIGNRTWGEIFQVALFADYAYGELNNPLPFEEETVNFSGWGIGLQFNVPDRFYARFDAAKPITERVASNDRDPQFYFRVSFSF